MLCPKCKSESKVIDSRDRGDRVRRRRQCLVKKCNHRWTTYEIEIPAGTEEALVAAESMLAESLVTIHKAHQRVKEAADKLAARPQEC